MNVFVLCTGRCGSVAFWKACSHFANYTSGHETLANRTGAERLAYPRKHIEIDNRLSWLLGRLDRAYGNAAHYVHLTRDPEAVARSFCERLNMAGGIGRAYRHGIIMSARGEELAPPLDAMRDYVTTVTENIELFLKDKRNVMRIRLEDIQSSFPEFSEWISAEGDLESAVDEFSRKHNAGNRRRTSAGRLRRFLRRAAKLG